MGSASLSVARDQLLEADRVEASANEVCEAIIGAFHQITRFDWCAVMTTDPTTHLPSGGVIEGFSPQECVPFWDNELLDADFNKFSDLARRIDPIATLYEAVDGDLARSPRYANMYVRLGVADELRVALVAGSSCLAVGVFVRSDVDGTFAPQELARVRELIPLATRVMRRALGRGLEEIGLRPPVVLLLDAEDRVTAITQGGRQMLDGLRTQSVDGDLPGLVQAAASRVRASPVGNGVTTRLQDRTGRWLRLHVSPIEGDTGGLVLTIEPATAGDVVQFLLESYELTARETEIALCICRGLPTKDIAAELIISSHTVRDHIKVILAKAGVATRGELMANLFSGHMFERFHANTSHLPKMSHPHRLSNSPARARSKERGLRQSVP